MSAVSALVCVASAASGQCRGSLTPISGPIFNGPVFDIESLDDGRTVAAGMFSGTVERPLSFLSVRDGSGWVPFAGGANSAVGKLRRLEDGQLYASGSFTTIGGTQATHIARWDGTAWHAIGTGPGFAEGHVGEMRAMPGGGLLVAGGFSQTTWPSRLSTWDGASWSTFAAVEGSFISSFCLSPEGTVIAAGYFSTANGPAVVARWNGQNWDSMGGNFRPDPAAPHYGPTTVITTPGGEIIVAGSFLFDTADGDLSRNIAKWDGSGWLAMGDLPGAVWSLDFLSTGELVAGGWLTFPDRQALVAIWTSGSWAPLVVPSPENENASVRSMRATSGGGLLLAVQLGYSSVYQWTPANSDFNGDGDFGTDADIEAFFACLAGNCCPACFPGGADFNSDGDTGTDADIESFFRVLAGGNC